MSSTDSTPVPSYPGLLRLDGRGFVVIGAGQGIGRQTAHALASAGARVLCVDKLPELAREVADEVSGHGFCADATTRDGVSAILDAAATRLGRIHGFVDILGMARYADLVDIDDENWSWHFDVCLRHAYLLGTLGGKRMAASGGGVMVFIASVSGLTSAPRHAAYGAAKAGLMSWVRTIAVELGPSRIRANAVAPGVVWTPRVSGYLGEEGRQRSSENAPLRRVAEPADIAAAALFLASDLSSFVTGQTLVVDGGVSAKFPFGMTL